MNSLSVLQVQRISGPEFRKEKAMQCEEGVREG